MDNTNLFVYIVSMLGILGIPSIFSICLYCIKAIKKHSKRMEILMNSQQEQMKTRLYDDYKKFKIQGYVSLEDLEIFESNYKAYHELGKNGVMTAKHDEILNMPNIPQQ